MAAARVKGYSLLLRSRPILPSPPRRVPSRSPRHDREEAFGMSRTRSAGLRGGSAYRKRRERGQTVKLARLARRGVNHDFGGILARDGMRFPPLAHSSSLLGCNVRSLLSPSLSASLPAAPPALSTFPPARRLSSSNSIPGDLRSPSYFHHVIFAASLSGLRAIRSLSGSFFFRRSHQKPRCFVGRRGWSPLPRADVSVSSGVRFQFACIIKRGARLDGNLNPRLRLSSFLRSVRWHCSFRARPPFGESSLSVLSAWKLARKFTDTALCALVASGDTGDLIEKRLASYLANYTLRGPRVRARAREIAD